MQGLGKTAFLALFLLVLVQSGFASDRVPVFVSIAPQKYLVQEVGKDLVDVQVMVAPGADPHTYEPKPRQMAALSRAKAYFAVGIEFERANLNRIISTNPEIRVVHTDEGIKKIPMQTQRFHREEGEPSGPEEHVHESRHRHRGLDPHIWLSPPLVMIQARAILRALQDLDPGNSAVYDANFRAFLSKVEALDNDLRKVFEGKEGLGFIVFHPAWGYFAGAYGLEQVTIEVEGKDPKPARLKAVIEHARENGIKVVFVQPQFSTRSAEVVAREIGGQVAFADPLAQDWLANMREVADKFQEALK